MRVLISGAGIAGPTLAYWLERYGVDVTVVERAPQARTGGYVIDFWGAGFDVAERMGVLPEVKRRGYQVQEVRFVDAKGRAVGGFPASSFARAANNRFTTVPRGELARVLIDAVRPESFRFGDSVAALEEDSRGVLVHFEHAPSERFELVVGADGLHSRVRTLAFGPTERYERYLEHVVAAFEVTGYRPRDEDVYLMFGEVGRLLARFSMRDDRTLFLFILSAGTDSVSPAVWQDIGAQKAFLSERFANSGWESPEVLALLRDTASLYFDRVSQIRMDHWTRGRIGLVGDAAACPSFLAGQGSALAMTEAYVLATELATCRGDHAAAFRAYEQRLQQFVRDKQDAATRLAGSFVPQSRLGLFARNQLSKLLRIGFVANLAVSRGLGDHVTLPDVAEPIRSERLDGELRAAR